MAKQTKYDLAARNIPGMMNRHQRFAGKIPQDEANGNTSQRKCQCLMADDPFKLDACCANRFQQAIKLNITRYRNTENIIDNQISGQYNEYQKHCNRCNG